MTSTPSLASQDDAPSADPAAIAQQAILLLLCGLLLYAALFYPKNSFRDRFATIHRHRLQRQHLQYRFSQSYLA